MNNNCSNVCFQEAQRPTGPPKSPICCMTECSLNSFGVLTDGQFDPVLAKNVLTKAIVGKDNWTSKVSLKK